MPHSVSPELTGQEDTLLPDAPLHGLDDEEVDDSNDIGSGTKNTSKAHNQTADIKLEELFGSDEEDDEFPNSSAHSAESAGTLEGDGSPALPMYYSFIILTVYHPILEDVANCLEDKSRPLRNILIPRLCLPSTSVFFPSVTYFNGSIMLSNHLTISHIESLLSRCRMMVICDIKVFLLQICKTPLGLRLVLVDLLRGLCVIY